FEVEGVDISSVAIERFQSTADSKGLKVKAEVKDLNEYSIQGEYDVIYSLRTLQYVDQSTGSRLVDEMRISTRKHGVNIIEAFRNLPPFSEEEPNYCTFKERELELRYGLWHILVYEEPELETPKKDKNDTIISQTGAFIAAMNTPRMYKWVVELSSLFCIFPEKIELI
ncbi:MAG: methyltransferase domain-containing protein, partial [Candidatus Nanoarchaeia archaeon]